MNAHPEKLLLCMLEEKTMCFHHQDEKFGNIIFTEQHNSLYKFETYPLNEKKVDGKNP